MEFLQIITPIASIIAALAGIALLVIKTKPSITGGIDTDDLRKEIRNGFENNNEHIGNMVKDNKESNRQIKEMQSERLEDFRKSIDSLNSNINRSLQGLQENQTQSITKMMEDNQKQLDKIRNSVDEKLSETIKTRFDESFKAVTLQLDKVNKSFTEMQTLANDVGSLNKTLSNVKQRGNWGEMQLENILTNIFSESQILRNVSTKGTKDKVEFCLVVKDKEKDVLLPIDSKFPMDRYLEVVAASEENDKERLTKAEKALVTEIKKQASNITKYINPPKTMAQAVMYLPTEGLYAEVAKQPDLIESIHREYDVLICGPNTLFAMLNSLSIAMKQIAINQRSLEIAQTLNDFKYEFKNFVSLVDKTKKKIDEASDVIGDTKKKTDTIQRKLDGLSDITDNKVRQIEDDDEE